jgi:transposase
MRSGRRWNRIAGGSSRTPVAAARTIGALSKAVLWIARTGSPWRELPPLFGRWNTVFKRYRDWVRAGVFQRLFEAVSDEPDMEYAMIDAIIPRCTKGAI